jgi:hypothetical protein
MSQLPKPAKLDRGEVIRNSQEVVNTNAALLIVDVTVNDVTGIVTFMTDGGDIMTLDLTGAFASREDLEAIAGVTPATEIKSGILKLATESMAKKREDHTTAITPFTLGAVLAALNIPTFAFEEVKTGQLLSLFVDEDGALTVVNVDKSKADQLEVTLDNLKGYVTSKSASFAGIIRNTQPVPIKRALGVAAWSANAPDQNALEMMFPEDLRDWLSVVRTITDGVDTGMFAMFRKNQNGTIDIVGKKPTIADVAANGYATPGPLGAGFFINSQEIPRVSFINNIKSEFYNSDIKGFVEVKIGVAELALIQHGLVPAAIQYARIQEQVKAEIAAAGGGGTVGGGTVTSLTYYIEELRCFQDVVNGGRDADGIPLDPAQERAYFKKLATKLGFEVGPDPEGSTAPVTIPMQTRYSARIRQIYADKTAAPSVEHIVFGPGENPLLGKTFERFIIPTERISADIFGSHSLDQCAGTGTAPAYEPPAPTTPAETFTGTTELWRRRKKVVTPVYKINDVYPSFEKSLGWIVGLVNAYGPNYVKLKPVGGLALTSFTDTGTYATELVDNGNGMPGTFRKIYVTAVSGTYEFSARSEGSDVWVTKTFTIARTGTAPVVSNPYPDQVVNLTGDQQLAAITGTFSDADGDSLTYTAGSLDGAGNPSANMPAGLKFEPLAAKPFTVTATMPNGSYPMFITAKDPDGNPVTTKWLLTVNRRAMTSLTLNNPVSVDEGTGAQLSATARYSDGSSVTITDKGLWFIAGADGIFRGAVITVEGATLGRNGLYTVAADSVAGNNRTQQVICQFENAQAKGTISVIDKTVVVANRPPIVSDPMPDVPISTSALQTFALPDTQFTDPDGDALTLTVTQTNGSALPAWLTYNPATRTFTKAADFSSGSVAVLVRAADSKGLSVADDFLVVVMAEAPVARKILSIDFEYLTQNGSSYLLWYITTNFGTDGLQMAISWPTDATYGAQEPGQWLNPPGTGTATFRILRDAPVAITAHFRDTNNPSAPEISFTVNRPANIRGNAARVNVYTATQS